MEGPSLPSEIRRSEGSRVGWESARALQRVPSYRRTRLAPTGRQVRLGTDERSSGEASFGLARGEHVCWPAVLVRNRDDL